MAFAILILEANHPTINKSKRHKHQHTTPTPTPTPHCQFLLRSLGLKDTYRTNSFIPFATFWDVPHWNSHYYPRLPRLVDYDPILHSQFNFDNAQWYRTPTFANTTNSTTTNTSTTMDDFSSSPTRIRIQVLHRQAGLVLTGSLRHPSRNAPMGMKKTSSWLLILVMPRGKDDTSFVPTTTLQLRLHRGVVAIQPRFSCMLQGAMRPHPALQAILDRLLIRASLLHDSSTVPLLQLDYMTLHHARVEPDMKKHKVCRDKKVLNLTDIFEFIQAKWKDPPVSKIFIPINRQYLELEGNIYNQAANSSRRGNVTKMKLNQTRNEKETKIWSREDQLDCGRESQGVESSAG
jgi:hypothetical protein